VLQKSSLAAARHPSVLLTALFDQQVTTLFRDEVSAIHRIELPRKIA